MGLFGLPFAHAAVRIAFVLIFIMCLPVLRAQQADLSGTMPEDYLPELKDILAAAAKRAPEVIAREFDHLIQEARILQVNAARLPQIGGNFNYGITETATASNTSSKSKDDGFFYSFGMSQAVWHWGALRNQSLAARINLNVADKQYALVYRDLAVLLRKSYLALIVERARLLHVREVLRLGREDVAVAEARKEMGLISASEVEGEKLHVRELELDAERAETEFLGNCGRLARVAGIPPFGEERVPKEIPRPSFSEPNLTLLASTVLRDNAKSSLEYEIYDLRIREATLRQKIENTRLLPKLGASANYSLENNTNVNGNLAEQRAVTRQSIGIGGSWTIFDSFATRGARREALYSKRSLEHQKSMKLDEVMQNVQLLDRSLRLDAKQLELTEIRRSLAVEAKNQIAEEVKYGNVSKGEVDRAQISILLADAQNLATRAAYLSHWSEFVSLTGQDPVLNNLPARYARAKN